MPVMWRRGMAIRLLIPLPEPSTEPVRSSIADATVLRHASSCATSACLAADAALRTFPFSVCLLNTPSPLSSWPPSLSAVLLAAPLEGLKPLYGTYEASDCCRHHPPKRQLSPLTAQYLPVVPSSTTWCARPSLSPPPQRDQLFQTSPWNRRLAATPRRIRFVLLRTDSSPPVAPHPASRRMQLLSVTELWQTPTRTCTVLISRPHGRTIPASRG